MKTEELRKLWKAEEAIAHIKGWDFSHIEGRYEQPDDYPWNYEAIIRRYLKPDMRILDMDTGGGEFLLSLNHPHHLTAVTEAYPPNAELCRQTLGALGIDVREVPADGTLPFPDASFDIVLNRHGSYNAQEIARVLKKDGLFITQQVGAHNDRDLVHLLQPELEEYPFSEQWRDVAAKKFEDAGLRILDSGEYFGPIRFFDIGALVWFARIIQWEFIGFSVEKCLDRLLKAQKIIDERGVIEGTIHRFMLTAQKK